MIRSWFPSRGQKSAEGPKSAGSGRRHGSAFRLGASPRPAVGPSPEHLFDEEFRKQLEYLAIVSKRVFGGRTRAERSSRKTGAGIEFADYRQYSPGDDYRYLDWNVYGRLGRLLVRLFQEEEDLWVYLLLDCSGSMGFGSPPKLTYAKKLVAALAYIALSHLDRVSVLTFGENLLSRLAPARGKNHIFEVFEFLRPATATGGTDLGNAMKTFVSQNKRRGVAVLVSDLYDPAGFESGVDTLRYAKFEPYVLQLIEPDDVHPELHGDVLLVDAESGAAREITVTGQLLQRYAAAHAAYCRRIAEYCREKQVPVFTLDTQTNFEDTVLRLLRHGGMVG